MRTGANPFTDPAEVQGPLYATPGRLAIRTNARPPNLPCRHAGEQPEWSRASGRP